MTPQVHISICADKGAVADSLRQLANYIEEYDSDNGSDYPSQYESDICVAEITED